MDVGNYIKMLRINHGMSQEQLGERCGVQRAAVQKWESGKVQNLKRETILLLSQIFDVSPASFVSTSPSYSIPTITADTVTFPVIGGIAASFDTLPTDSCGDDTIEIPASYLHGRTKDDYFVLRVEGDSMYPLFLDGDRILILKADNVDENGCVAAVSYDGEFTSLKKVVKTADGVQLTPINPMYRPINITGAALDQFHIQGIPKLVIRKL